MEKVQPQRTELYAYLQFYMEELFQDSCRAVQTILDTDSGKIWKNFHAVLQECLEKTRILQQQKQKGLRFLREMRSPDRRFVETAIYRGWRRRAISSL